jgi:hypothetical protein
MARAILRSVVAVAAVVLGVVVLFAAVPGLPDLNPFGTETKDRSQPVVLRSLERLTEYRAASANLEVVVDVEKDGILPGFHQGDKTLLVASGNVDAAVDFRGLGRDGLRVSEDRRSVTITLPPAQLTEAKVDLDRSRVFDRDRGLLDRVGSSSTTTRATSASCCSCRAQARGRRRADGGVLTAAERNTGRCSRASCAASGSSGHRPLPGPGPAADVGRGAGPGSASRTSGPCRAAACRGCGGR